MKTLQKYTILELEREKPFQQDETALWYPRWDSNPGFRLRRPTLYPLSYGGWRARFYHNLSGCCAKMTA